MRDFIQFLGSVIIIAQFPMSAYAQCALDVNVVIADTTSTTLLINVENLANDDLSTTQSLCAVQLRFRHSYVGDLTIDLVSPSGQSVQLVGAVTDLISPTNLTTWDVRFVQCGFPAAPDPGFSAQWSNEQAWQILTTYNGTYHPASGCLEDFNTGSANGIWQLVLTDHDALQTGSLLGVTLIFCDNTGLECNFCGADAGAFANTSVEICEGSNVAISTAYPDTLPDPNLYRLEYLIEDASGAVTVVDAITTATMVSGQYTICGMSYARDDSAGLYQQIAPMSLDQIRMAFNNGSIPFCADLSPNCVSLDISPAIDTTFLAMQICGGECVQVGGRTFCTTGTHVARVDVPGACDSIYILDLTVVQVTARITQQDTISCNEPITVLDGSTSTAGPGAVFSWTTLDGTVIGPSDQQMITINGAGSYTLTITYQGCVHQRTHSVVGDGSIPFISVRGGTLTCRMPTYTFNTVVFPTNVSVVWNGPGGFSSNQLRPTVSVPGIYYILATDPDGCAASRAVEVLIDTVTIKPQVVTTIDCINQRTFLSGTPGNLDHQYNWTGPGGFTYAFRQFWATVPGTYCATLTPPNGCPATTCIDVQSDYTIPDITISASADTLHCGQQIDLTASSTTSGVSYSWTGPAGPFASVPDVTIISSGSYVATALAPNGCQARDTAIIVDGLDVFAAQVFGDTLNCAIDTGLIGAVTFEPGATYAWSGPGVVDPFDAFTRVTTPGIYQVSVTVGTCTRVLNVRVVGDYAIPNFTAFTDTITCIHPVAELSMLISSPYSEIVWQQPDGSMSNDSVLLSSLPGIHRLTIFRANGCSLTKIVRVPADTARPIVFLESGLLGCDSTQINVISTDSIVAFSWTGPSGFTSQSAAPFVHEGGVYLLDATGLNGCMRTTPHFVDTSSAIPQTMTSQELLDCLDSMAILSVMSPDSGVTYAWFLNGVELSDSSVLDVRVPGTYIAVTTGINSCSATDTIVVEPPKFPDVMTRTDTITCIRSARLEATSNESGATFTWQDTSGNTTPGAVYLTLLAGPVQLTVTGINGCTHDTTVVVEIDTMPPIAIAQNHEMVLCNVQTISLDASASVGQWLTFLWTTTDGIINSGSTSANPTITGEGTYIVAVTDSMNGCAHTDSVEVIEGQSTLGLIEFTVIPECEGNSNGSILIDSVPGAATDLTFALDGVAGGPLFTGLSSGQYVVTAIDSFGCFTDTVVVITNTSSMSSVNLGPDQVITLGDSTLLEAEINLDPSQLMSVRWLDFVSCDSCLSNVVSPLHTTVYDIEIEDVFGCIARDAVTVYVEERAKFFIPNIFSPNGDGANDRLAVLTHPGVARVQRFSIFDRWGDVVYHQVDFDGSDGNVSWDGRAEGNEVNPGVFVYLLELKLITGRSEIFTGTLTLIK